MVGMDVLSCLSAVLLMLGIAFIGGLFASLICEMLDAVSRRVRRFKRRRRHAKHNSHQRPHGHREDFQLREPWDDLNGYDDRSFPG